MKCSSKVLKCGSSKVLFARQGVAPMNLCVSVSLCETWIHYVPSTITNVTTYPLLSCGTNITRYVWGLDLSGTPQGAGGVGGLCAVFSPLLKGGGGEADGGLSYGITPHYPCYDANGNITEYVDITGNTVAHYAYDAFGNAVSQIGSMADDFKHRFSTQYLDVETGLYYYGRIRYYSPPLGRFISRDPIGERGGLNLYGFCGNDPINKWDYLGMIIGGCSCSRAEDPTLPEKRFPCSKVVLEVKKCEILVVYGHNFENPQHDRHGTGLETIRVIRAAKKADSCAYAAVLACNAANIPNQIPLPGYTPVSSLLIGDRGGKIGAGNINLDMLPDDEDEAKRIMAAAEVAANTMFENCCCKSVKLSIKTFGLKTSIWTTVDTVPPSLVSKTFYPPKEKK